jgi:hypothetical protein
MGAFAGTVTINRAYHYGGSSTKKVRRYNVTLTLSTQGGATNSIPASAFTLTKIEGASSAVYSDNSAVVPLAPSADGTLLLVGGGASNAPQDISATITFEVWGY